jgi:hypothetical protein
MCYVHVAALVAEYLRRKGAFSVSSRDVADDCLSMVPLSLFKAGELHKGFMNGQRIVILMKLLDSY